MVAETAAPETRTTLAATIAQLRAGELSCTDLMHRSIAEAARLDRPLGIFQSRFDDTALAAAQTADKARAAGADIGVLGGIPLAVKDLISTADGPTTGGSLINDRPWNRPHDGAAVSRLRAAGAIVLGKTVTNELGMGSPDAGAPFPIPRNPWDRSRWTGGSSAGTACAIAAGVVPAGLGTDSGGSIRQPSAFCGVSGLKPSYGLVPRDGSVPMSWSTDHLGPMAVSARDCALLLTVMAGYDPADPGCVRLDPTDYLGALDPDLSGLRIGVDPMDRVGGAVADADQPSRFREAVSVLADLGAQLIDVELPHYQELTAAAMVTTLSEALAYHGRDLAQRWSQFFPRSRGTFGLAAYFTGADYVQAQRVRRVVKDEIAQLFARVDLVAMPTAAVVATPHDRLDDFVSSGEFFAVYSTYWNMAGNPALSVPIGRNRDGLPLAMQLAGPMFDDGAVLRVGDAYQQRTRWHLDLPPGISARM